MQTYMDISKEEYVKTRARVSHRGILKTRARVSHTDKKNKHMVRRMKKIRTKPNDPFRKVVPRDI